MRHLLAAAAIALIASHAVAADAPSPAPAAAPKPVDELEANFVIPETAKRYAALLRAKRDADAYADISDPSEFGRRVTADLQALAPDGHLRLGLQSEFERRRPPASDRPKSTIASGPDGLEAAEMIGPKRDIAYLRFNMFPRGGETPAKARAFLLAHPDARAVVIDARPHRGGTLDVMDAVLPLFYATPTTLVRMETRAAAEANGPMNPSPYLVRRDSPPEVVRRDHVIRPDAAETRLVRTPVYYLTSRFSASAAEHLALAFRHSKRATIIGETTRGAGHYGGLAEIGSRFAAFVPIGRTFDPDTGEDWEGKGIRPDVEIPADDALAEALKRIG